METFGTRIRALKAKYGVKVAVVDYMQIMRASRNDSKLSNYERVTAVSGEITRLASELDIAIIAVSQFNREGGKSDRPSMHDSDGSSRIEKDAAVYLIVDREGDSPLVTLRIVKGRNSGTGTIQGKFTGRCVKFEI